MNPLFKGLNVVSLTVTDLSTARQFCSDVLGLGDPWFAGQAMGWVEWGADGQAGNLAITLSRDGATPKGGTTPPEHGRLPSPGGRAPASRCSLRGSGGDSRTAHLLHVLRS